jgi:hypothetical protein
MEIKFDKLQSATVSVSATSVDYEITADAFIQEVQVTNINNGQVKKDGAVLSTFSSYRIGQLTNNFENADTDDYCNITSNVIEFIDALRNSVTKVSFGVTNE